MRNNTKKEQLINLLRGLLLIALGVLLLLHSQWVWYWVWALSASYFAVMLLKYFLLMLKKRSFENFYTLIGSAIFFFLVVININRYYRMFYILIGFWTLFNSFIDFINYLVIKNDNLKGSLLKFIKALINLVIGISLVFISRDYSFYLSLISGIYLVSFGLFLLIEVIVALLREKTNASIVSRYTSLSLPVLISAIIPYRFFHNFKAFKEIYVPISKQNYPLEVIFYIKESGFESFGHVDISYRGTIYSYGCHDPENRRLFGALGDGVLIVSPRDAFLKNAMANEGQMIITYGLDLSEHQDSLIKKRLDEFMSRAIPWSSLITKDPKAIDYASRVYKNTKARMFKFKEGKFKTYFLASTNCVLLADEIIRSKECELINLNGFITPGTYLGFLNQEYTISSNLVKERNVYKRSEKRKD